MKKHIVSALSMALCLGLTAGSAVTVFAEDTKTIDSLKIAFSPYADSDTITTATEPLEDLLKETLLTKGYDVENVDMTVGTSYTAVGQALSAGSADIGFIFTEAEITYFSLMTVTFFLPPFAMESTKILMIRKIGMMVQSKKTPMRCLPITVLLFWQVQAKKGQALLEKVNNGEELTWDDLNDATWAVMGPTSASGYIYPSLWLNEKYGKGISDLANAVESDSYTTSLARLASGQADVMVSYGHIRTKYAPEWKETFGGTDDMVNQTGVIGVTDKIYNDMIAYSKTSEVMQDEDFRQALGDSFIEIANTDEGKDIISVFSQVGYEWGDDSNYDGEREAQELLKSME